MLTKMNQSKKVEITIYALIFALMLLFNVLSPYIMDDYKYLFSFADDSRMTHISQLIPSMIGHAHHMNGRLVAHGLVQLFMLLPMWLFDIVNALMFLAQIALINRLCRATARSVNIMIPVIFCILWLFEPVFAQVNLWQDGSCNYLWSVVFCLVFLLPFVEEFLYDRTLEPIWLKCLFCVYAFIAGAFSETISAASIFIAGVLVLTMMVFQKKSLRAWWVASIVAAFAGYLTIYLAPAQWVEKAAQMHPRILFSNLVNVTYKFQEQYAVLVCAFVVLLVINLMEKTDWKVTFLSVVFFLGALAAHFIMIFADYYTPRTSVGAFVLLVIATLTLLYPLLGNLKHRILIASALCVLVLATIPEFLAGTLDIMLTNIQLEQNVEHIYECKENGIMDVQLPLIESSTKYSIANGRKYLDPDPEVWPNYSMADYYGVDTISILDD